MYRALILLLVLASPAQPHIVRTLGEVVEVVTGLLDGAGGQVDDVNNGGVDTGAGSKITPGAGVDGNTASANPSVAWDDIAGLNTGQLNADPNTSVTTNGTNTTPEAGGQLGGDVLGITGGSFGGAGGAVSGTDGAGGQFQLGGEYKDVISGTGGGGLQDGAVVASDGTLPSGSGGADLVLVDTVPVLLDVTLGH